MERVLKHYQQEGDREKLDAARFLIGNMQDKKAVINRSNTSFLEILDRIDSLWGHGNAAMIEHAALLKASWDSLTVRYGAPRVRETDIDTDLEHIQSEYLIHHIDQVFKVWRESPWKANVDFSDFCEYILPYRVGTESLEPWAERLYAEWLPKIKEEGLDSIYTIARHINDFNSYRTSHMRMFWSYPYDFNSSEFERIRTGSCKHGVYYTTLVLRSVGIPTVVDYTPKWAGANNGHEWNAIFLEDGSLHPFDAIHRGLKIDLSWRRIAKVYRKTFADQKIKIDEKHEHEIPKALRRNFDKDVTGQYVDTKDIIIPIEGVQGFKYAVISTYHGFDWVPHCWGDIENGKAKFDNMGVDNLYAVFVHDNGSYVRKSEPFLLDSIGNIQFFKPDYTRRQDMRLERKFPLTPHMEGIMSFVVGNKIQGGNTRNFQDSATFFTITETPKNIESVGVNDRKKYRYVRMWIPPGGRGDMAELEFYGLSANGRDTVKLSGDIIGDPKADLSKERYYAYPFDGDLLTYYLKPRGVDPWIGLDLGTAQQIVKVRYCPRSDTNFIEVGDLYELFLWDGGAWKSQGQLKATDQYLVYPGMPSNGLFILVNKSKGIEHRIFTYENGKQIWQ
ncbi:transglutaminase domain-containing protein [Sphingobacterium sp. DN00404]|uniref:Transglutaminase domain-containing protein n=1 Tax=Sphingobacterium micropteri TaxID=2763501 RepID=A0ABR7YNW9_9SPHI|nr:transglutaminase domain-containing protein [Sphingobacterium micropteri]MBD1432868.1 transglutaminase domain-containing protein [Sphingobacterium micropteri]